MASMHHYVSAAPATFNSTPRGSSVGPVFRAATAQDVSLNSTASMPPVCTPSN